MCLLYCAAADYNLVALKIPLGDRPDCGEIDLMKAEGLKEMVHLMKRCWEKNPLNRPTFKGSYYSKVLIFPWMKEILDLKNSFAKENVVPVFE